MLAATRPAFDLATMLVPVLPWWELLVRGIIVYGFLLGLIRLTGRRQTGMMTPFDFILLLILSNTVQNAMNGGDNSLGGGLFLAGTLICINWCNKCWDWHPGPFRPPSNPCSMWPKACQTLPRYKPARPAVKAAPTLRKAGWPCKSDANPCFKDDKGLT